MRERKGRVRIIRDQVQIGRVVITQREKGGGRKVRDDETVRAERRRGKLYLNVVIFDKNVKSAC